MISVATGWPSQMVNTNLPDDWYEMVANTPGFPLARRVAFVAMLILALGLLNVYAPAAPTLAERVLSTSTLAVAALPLWLWLSGFDRGAPFMSFFAMVYSVYYAVPMFLLESYGRAIYSAPYSDRLMTQALGLVLAGLLAVLLGYYGPQREIVARVLPKFSLRWRGYGNVKLWAMVFSMVGLSIYLLKMTIAVPEALDQFVVYGGELCSIGICTLFVLHLVGRLDSLSATLLWAVLVPLRLLLGLSTGAIYQVLAFVLMLVLTYAIVRRAMPWKTLAVGVLAFFVLRPVMSSYRALTWKRGAMSGLSRVEKVKLASRMIVAVFSGGVPSEGDKMGFQFALSRLATDLMTLPEVLRDTPDHVPYWKGESYYPLLTKPIPRALFPNKPKEGTGGTFGHRYGLLSPDDDGTSYNLAQLTECYINFGSFGVIVGMFLYGLLARAIQDAFVHPGMGLGAVVAVAYVSVELLAIESAASMMLGGLMFTFVFIGLINLVVQAGELHTSNADVGS